MDSDRDIYFKNLREIVTGSSQYPVIRWVMALLEGIPNISKGKKSIEDLISKLEGVVLSDPNDHDTLWCLGNAHVSCTLYTPEPELATHPFRKACMYFQKAFEKDTSNEIYWKSLLMNKKEVPELHMLIHTYSPDQKLMPERVMLYKKTRDMSIFDNRSTWFDSIILETMDTLPGSDRRFEDIISDLEELLSIDPNDPDVLWCLGNLHASTVIDLDAGPDVAKIPFRKTCMYYQHALQKDPTNELYKKSLQMTNELSRLHQVIHNYSSDDEKKLTPGPVILFNQAQEMPDSETPITKEVPELHRNMHEDEPDQQLAGGVSSGSSNTTDRDRDRGSDQLDSSVELSKISFLIDRNEIVKAQKSLKDLLEKYPKCFAAMALKARVPEVPKENAVEVCQQLVKLVHSVDEEELTDDALRSMEAACLSINQLELASNCYKDCYSNAKKDMSLRNRFLMGRIRCCYFMEQFEELRKLAHLLAENLVSSERDPEEVEIANIWLCCAYQLEAYAPYTTNRDDLLQLAAVSVKLISAQRGFITKGGLIMAISLFENCCMYENVLAAIEKLPNMQLASDVDVLLIKGRILHETCQYNAACDTFQQLLHTCPDWPSFLCYLDSLLEGKESSLSKEEVNSRLATALDLASGISKESHSDPIFLHRAKLEIQRRKHLFGEKADLVDALIKYFNRAGQLSSFIFDATTSLKALCFFGKGKNGDVEMNNLLKLMYNCFRPLENRPSGTLAVETIRPANVRDFCRMITMHKIQLAIMDDTFKDNNPVPATTDEERKVEKKIKKLEQTFNGPDFDRKMDSELKMVRKMVADYYTHLHLSKNIRVGTPIYGEELLSMTFDLLLQMYWRDKESSCLMAAMGIVEFGLTLQMHSHEYRTLLILIYSFVGAFDLAYNHYKELQLTNSLLMGECLHNFLPLMLKSPSSAPLEGIIDDYISQMEVSMKSSLNRTYIGFDSTTEVQQVVETYVFINRMKNSHQFVSAKIEDFILELSQNSVLFEEQNDFGEDFLLDEEKLKSLTFSEDLSSRPWWTLSLAIDHLLGKRTGPKFVKSLVEDESLGKRRSLERKVLQRRSLIPRLMYLSVQAANKSLVDESEFKKYLQTYARSFAKSWDEAYVFIDAAVRGEPRKDLCSVSDTLDWVNFAVFLFGWSFCKESDFGFSGPTHHKGFDLWYIVVRLVDILKNQCLELQEPALAILNGIIQMAREPVSWYLLIVKAHFGWLRSTPPGAASKSQKKKHRSLASKRRKDLGKSIKSLKDTLNSITTWLDKQCESLAKTLRSDDLMAAYQKQYYDSIDLKSSADLGDRISMAVKSWDQSTVPRSVLSAQRETLVKFSEMCVKLLKETEELLEEAGVNEDNG